jgi:predicted amidohydrolase YtcJ
MSVSLTKAAPAAAVLLATTIATWASQPAPAAPADLVLRNGKVVTVDAAKPEAAALAVTAGRIAAVGTNEEIAAYIGPSTEVIDLAGRLAIPGFVEAHGHFTGIGSALMQLRLEDTRSWDEIVAMVGAAAARAKPGEWIFGRGWHQEKWTSVPSPNAEGFPLHASLDAVSRDNPVVLTHASGHGAYANARALELSGITRATRNPPGGEIVRDEGGNPAGFLKETAARLLKTPPAGDPATIEQQAALAAQDVIAKGVTSFQDAGSSFATIEVLKRMSEAGRLPVRLWMMVRDTNQQLQANLPRARTVGAANGRFTVRAIKKTLDGALGSRGAWLLEPYADLPTTSGLNVTTAEEVRQAARLALAHDYQLAVHAIGDRANREVLDIYERSFRQNPAAQDLRWRIEHAQHLNAADIPRFGQLGVIASMQGIHATSDAPYVVARLGARRAEEGAYVWQKLMTSGAVIANGTDAPVEDVNPILNFHATVSRRTADGSVFYPNQRMTRTEALRSQTSSAAYAAFEDDAKGSLSAGKLADIVVLSKDIMTVPEDEIPTTRVVYTIIGGDVVYRGVN